MHLVWTSLARRDLNDHVEYIARQNLAAALRVDEAVREAVERLLDQPHRGRPGQRVGTRELVIPEFPAYVVVYRVTTTEVRVLRTRQQISWTYTPSHGKLSTGMRPWVVRVIP